MVGGLHPEPTQDGDPVPGGLCPLPLYVFPSRLPEGKIGAPEPGGVDLGPSYAFSCFEASVGCLLIEGGWLVEKGVGGFPCAPALPPASPPRGPELEDDDHRLLKRIAKPGSMSPIWSR